MEEGEGESSSPARPVVGHDIRHDIYARLLESGNEEATSNPDLLDQLDAHLSRLPQSYAGDVNMDRVEDVLLHMKILEEAKDPEKRPIFHVRCMKTKVDGNDDLQQTTRVGTSSKGCDNSEDGDLPLNLRNRDCGIDFEPCSKLEDLNLNVRKNGEDVEERYPMEALSARQNVKHVPVHEIIFSSIDKPKLLSQLSALLSDVGLDIREAHVFSTIDGYSLDVFVVDGWPLEATDGLLKELKKAVARNEGSWSGTSYSSAGEKMLTMQRNSCDWEIDKRLLKMGDRIACGSCGDLYRGTYLGQDVAIKVLRSEHLNEALGVEFAQEVMILREVYHMNVVHFIGACTKPPQFCIVTEYMTGGNLYDLLHKHHNVLELSLLLKFAIDISRGMSYLHQNNIIHRDLKTANLLMDTNNVVKVADFGVARFQSQEGDMTAETGTYRWMAPEVISHQPYDHKADVFSFAIVLWELVTSKVPYETMTPLQAALGVRQGLRPEIPENTHPKLIELMKSCWEVVPAKRPSFSEITIELEELLQQIQYRPVPGGVEWFRSVWTSLAEISNRTSVPYHYLTDIVQHTAGSWGSKSTGLGCAPCVIGSILEYILCFAGYSFLRCWDVVQIQAEVLRCHHVCSFDCYCEYFFSNNTSFLYFPHTQVLIVIVNISLANLLCWKRESMCGT